MSKIMHVLCTSLCALAAGTLQADSPGNSFETDFSSVNDSVEPMMPIQAFFPKEAEAEESFSPPAVVESPKKMQPVRSFKAFTGKIKGRKVRLRAQPDLEGSIAKELNRGEFLSVIGETDDFWTVEAPADLKAYVFRPYVLDSVIEGNRVNVRLSPNTEAPVVAQLNSGDSVANGQICAANSKWIEIPMPATARFYVAKSYLENVGGPEVKNQYEHRVTLAKQLLETAECFSESEMQKNYPDVNFDKINHNFQILIREYEDFPSLAEQAKERLAQVQEKFIDKRISYMESSEIDTKSSTVGNRMIASLTDKMKLWEPLEEALYLSWITANEAQNATSADYYSDQKLASDRITGILEAYPDPVKCKPGDFIVRQNDLPVGYVYSTIVNLQELVGQQVTLIGAPRPNNNFAFPAFFVLDVEK